MADEKKVTLWLSIKDGITSAIKGIEGTWKKSMTSLKDSSLLFAGAAAGIVAGVFGMVKQFGDSQAVAAQTEKVLNSTGYAAGMTAEAVKNLANELSKKTGIDDDVIASGENIFLTFTGIGKEAFPLATKTALDMTAAMNDGVVTQEALRGTTIQVGKALNDPIMGMTALKKVGVMFTESQKEQITVLQSSGKLYEAQKIVLDELQKEFGGSSEKLDTFKGAQLRAQTAIGNLAETIGGSLAPIIQKLTNFVSSAAEYFSELYPKIQEYAIPVGAAVAITVSLIAGLAGIVAIAPMVGAAVAVMTGPIGIVSAAIGLAVGAVVYFTTSTSELAVRVRSVFSSLGDIFSNFGLLVKSALTLDISGIKTALAEMRTALAENYKAELSEQESSKIKSEEIEKQKNDKQISEKQKTFAASEELARLSMEAERQLATEQRAFEVMTEEERLKYLEESLGQERILKDTNRMQELIAKKQFDEARKIQDQLYNDAYLGGLKKRLADAKNSEDKNNIDLLTSFIAYQYQRVTNEKLTTDQINAIKQGGFDFFSNLSALTRAKNYEFYMIGKRSSQVNAGIQTAEAAIKSYNWASSWGGPIAGAAAAAAAALAGAVQISAIEGATFQAAAGAYAPGDGATVKMGELGNPEWVMNEGNIRAIIQETVSAANTKQTINLIVNRQTLQSWGVQSALEQTRLQREGRLPNA